MVHHLSSLIRLVHVSEVDLGSTPRVRMKAKVDPCFCRSTLKKIENTSSRRCTKGMVSEWLASPFFFLVMHAKGILGDSFHPLNVWENVT